MGSRITSFLVVILIIIVALQSSFAIYKVYEATTPDRLTAQASSGSITLCINNPPIFLPFLCNTTLTQNVLYTCQLFATEADNATLTYFSNTTTGSLKFNVSINGLISATPNQSTIGNHSVVFSVSDGSSCSNAVDYLYVNFTVLDVNDPPRYLPNYGLELPMGPYQWDLSSSLRGIYLNTFFDDIDGDVLTYSYYSLSPGFSVSITPATEIILGAITCGTGFVFFRATDTHAAYADSGLVSLDVPCEEEPPAAGGGGFDDEDCISDWRCDSWGRCLPTGIQRRKCIDINACNDDYIKWYEQECEYIEQCYNGIQDFFWEGNELNEEGIDCGGPCEVCQTCIDGLLNNGEEAIDCGGPNCAACVFCDDNIQNFGESGVDCGGPCDPCPSCFDKIMNQNETGVDCGGPCSPCTRIETPSPIKTKSLFVAILSIILGIIAVLLILYRLFRRQIHAAIAKLLWYVTRNRQKQVLLKPEQKEELLKQMAETEANDLLSNPKKYAQFQNEMSRTLHSLFEMLLENRKLRMGVAYEKTLEAIGKLKTTKQVKNMLRRHFAVLLYMERKEILAVEELKTLFEFLRQEVFSLSKITREDVARPIEEITLVEKPEDIRFLQMTYNAILALQFNEISIAKKKYLASNELYGKLVTSEQEKLYSILRLLFEQITYTSSYYQHTTFGKSEKQKKKDGPIRL